MIARQDFEKLMAEIGMPAAAERYEDFAAYCSFLREYNEKVNLTAITDDESIAVKHFADSLLPLTLFDVPRGTRLIDVGTGAGFPGVPIKLVRPDVELALLDPLEKRLVFLRELCGRLGIAADTIHLRAEQAGADKVLRESYDIATSRAVASLGLLAEYCLPLLLVGGAALAMKGGCSPEEERDAERAIRLCGGALESVRRYSLPGGDERTLYVIRKISHTPTKYPRPTAKIGKKPL